MGTVIKSSNWSIGGKNFSRSETLSGEGSALLDDVQLPAGQSGNATVAGTVVLVDAPVDLVEGDKVGVFWEGGQRISCSITDITGDTLTLSGGVGATLPASTAVVVAKTITARMEMTGDDIQILSVQVAAADGVVEFLDDTDTQIIHINLEAGQADGWDSDSGLVNPFAGKQVATISFCASTTVSTGVFLAALLDSI